MLVAGPLLSAIVLSLMGLVDNIGMLALVLVVGGLGIGTGRMGNGLGRAG